MNTTLTTSQNQRDLTLEDELFRDSSGFKAWLLREEDSSIHDLAEPCYHFIYSMIQEMSQFRFHAEEFYKNHSYLAQSKYGELPVKRKDVKAKFFSNQKDPPETVISRIAQNQLYVIESVTDRIRKILRRERELTHLSNIQQIDTQCLVWWTRQPGRTAAEKAGKKQKLLSVVRNESYDILENRVLKEVLKLCVAYCRRYLKQYDSEQFHKSDRIQAVRRLYNTAQRGLQLEIMKSVSVLNGMPQPNYVLLHDRIYSQIWTMYRNLLRQTALMEYIWQNRTRFFQEYLLFCLTSALDFEEPETINVLFDSDYWFSSDFKKEGCFLKNTSFQRCFLVKESRSKIVFSFDSSDASLHGHQILASIKKDGKRIKCISASYLPKECTFNLLDYPKVKNHTYFILSESHENVIPSREDLFVIDLSKDLFYQINDWLHALLGEYRHYEV